MKIQQTLRRSQVPDATAADLLPATSAAFDSLTSSLAAATFTVTAGTAHEKGSYVQVFAATQDDIDLLRLTVPATATSGFDTASLLDIAIGQPGSEVVVAPNIQVGAIAATNILEVPVHIPAGSRVVARVQSAVASKSILIVATGGKTRSGVPSPSAIDNLGADTANSRGVALNNSGTDNTPGTWTEITSATSQAYQGLLMLPDLAGDTDVPASACVIELAAGGSGSEVVIGTWQVNTFATEGLYNYTAPEQAVYIPAGTRLSARVRFATASGNAMGVSLLGVPFG